MVVAVVVLTDMKGLPVERLMPLLGLSVAARQPFPCPHNPILQYNGARRDLPMWLPNEIMNCSCPPGLSVTAVLPPSDNGAVRDEVIVPAKVCRIQMDRIGLQPLVLYGGDLQAIGPTGWGINRGNYQVDSHMSDMALNQRAVMVDIGANMGITSIAFALVYPQVTVHAYELNPVTFQFLQRNIVANGLVGRVIPHNVGLGRGPVRLSHCAISTRFGNQMIGSEKMRLRCGSIGCKHLHEHIENCTSTDQRHYNLPTITVAAALRAVGGSIGVLKVDCEGCEWDILDELVSVKKQKRTLRLVGDCHAVGGVSRERMQLCRSIMSNSHTMLRRRHQAHSPLINN